MIESPTSRQVSIEAPATGPMAIGTAPLDTLSFAGLLMAIVAGGLLLVLNRRAEA